MILGAHELQRLAAAYCDATGETLWSLGRRAVGNTKLFSRLSDGFGCNVLTAERAGNWLRANWPADVPWPSDVPIISAVSDADADCPQSAASRFRARGIPRSRNFSPRSRNPR